MTHELLNGKPLHKSDGIVTESVPSRFPGVVNETTHCKLCGCKMTKPVRVEAIPRVASIKTTKGIGRFLVRGNVKKGATDL